MKNNIMKARFTKEEMIGRIYMAVEGEKEIMNSDLVEKHEDIVGKKISSMAVEMACSAIDEIGYELVKHINLISSSEFNTKELISFYSFIVTESKHCNRAISEVFEDENMDISDVSGTLITASIVYKILQRLVEAYLKDNKGECKDKAGEALKEALEHNSVQLIQKATDIKRRQVLEGVLGSLL